VNLILHLGGTLYNLRKPDGAFKVIHDSMGINDYLMQTTKLDSEATRKHFDFNVKPGEPLLAPIHGFIVDLLGIDPTFYSLELGYDAEHRERYERIRFKLAVTIEFEFNGGKRVISFDKGDAVLIWRGWQYGALDVADQFDRNSFYTLHASQTADREYLLTIAQVKRT
jgi:hypothetical protein